MNKKLILALIVICVMCTSLVAAGFLDSITGRLFNIRPAPVFIPPVVIPPTNITANAPQVGAVADCVYKPSNVDTSTGKSAMDGKTPAAFCKELDSRLLPVLIQTKEEFVSYDALGCTGNIVYAYADTSMKQVDVFGTLGERPQNTLLATPVYGTRTYVCNNGVTGNVKSGLYTSSDRGVLCCFQH